MWDKRHGGRATVPQSERSGHILGHGVIYVLTNPYMPGLVKIGRMRPARAGQRVAELFTTAAPAPFDVAYAAYVRDPGTLEATLHRQFGVYRVHRNREHFEIAPERAITALEAYAIEDVTAEVRAYAQDVDLFAETEKAGERKQPEPDLFKMGLSPDTVLVDRASGQRMRVAGRWHVRTRNGRHVHVSSMTADGQRRLDSWTTLDGVSLRWLYDNVQLGDAPSPWADDAPSAYAPQRRQFRP